MDKSKMSSTSEENSVSEKIPELAGSAARNAVSEKQRRAQRKKERLEKAQEELKKVDLLTSGGEQIDAANFEKELLGIHREIINELHDQDVISDKERIVDTDKHIKSFLFDSKLDQQVIKLTREQEAKKAAAEAVKFDLLTKREQQRREQVQQAHEREIARITAAHDHQMRKKEVEAERREEQIRNECMVGCERMMQSHETCLRSQIQKTHDKLSLMLIDLGERFAMEFRQSYVTELTERTTEMSTKLVKDVAENVRTLMADGVLDELTNTIVQESVQKMREPATTNVVRNVVGRHLKTVLDDKINERLKPVIEASVNEYMKERIQSEYGSFTQFVEAITRTMIQRLVGVRVEATIDEIIGSKFTPAKIQQLLAQNLTDRVERTVQDLSDTIMSKATDKLVTKLLAESAMPRNSRKAPVLADALAQELTIAISENSAKASKSHK